LIAIGARVNMRRNNAHRYALAMRLAVNIVLLSWVIPVQADDLRKYSDEALRKEISDTATTMRAILVPMRDGVGLSTDVYLPKTAGSKLPTVFWRTPYDEQILKGMTLHYAALAIRHGYAFVVQNERGRYFSEGKWDILGRPQTDGYDTLTWIANQRWSNAKVGTLGCSSSAEWQLALAGLHHPALRAMVPMSAGAGIGKVGRYQEQGNWYTGGVPRNLFFIWLYKMDNPLRAQIPSELDQKLRARLIGYNNLNVQKPAVDWQKWLTHLPVDTLLSDLGEPPDTFESFIDRTPADPAWKQGGLYHEGMGWAVPTLWFNAWYDLSIGPNLELFNYVRIAGDPNARTEQYMVVAPAEHCEYLALGKDTISGDRLLGDTSFDVDGTIVAWFDRWLKDDERAFSQSTPHVRYFTMGANRWNADNAWPPTKSHMVRMYLHGDGAANSLFGDGRLDTKPPTADEPPDHYQYNPLNPVQTVGGGECCNGGLVKAGAFDQRVIEARNDVLIYSTEPLAEPLEVTGFVETVLQVSSSAKDTDFTVKVVDVAPDGTAIILADTIMRARYRNGYDRPSTLEPGRIETIHFTPMATSNCFAKGHRIRVEITSSNFPKYERNLNTGLFNESETSVITARNEVHHTVSNSSYLDLPVVGR
jgi:putative CocE/NonD family hydrolase